MIIFSMKRYISSIITLFWSLICIAGNFNPSNPPEPNVYYNVKAVASPKKGGTVRPSQAIQYSAGKEVYMSATANSQYTFEGWYLGDSLLSIDTDFTYIVPEYDSEITAVFKKEKYNPISPGEPSVNSWNEETGEMIIDNFTPGEINSAIYDAIGSYNYDAILKLTISGEINGDLSIMSSLPNCYYLDISRIKGCSIIEDYQFYENTTLSNIILPSCIESIGSYAFYNNTNLTSITCYATMPPTVSNNTFEGIADGAVLYVLSSSIPLYSEAEEWKNFTILPISTNTRNLSVSLPNGCEGKYKNMIIELANLTTGVKQKFVTTDRMTYTFNGLLSNSQYKITLRNSQGTILGVINNVSIVEEDKSVTFESLLTLNDVSIKILTPNGNDVTSQTSIIWYDDQGTYLGEDFTLQNQTVNTELIYSVALDNDLGIKYHSPAKQSYTVVDGINTVICTLSAIETTTVTGIIKEKNGTIIKGASIAFSQLLNGKFSKTTTTITDKNGCFTAEIFNAETSISVSTSSHVAQAISVKDFNTSSDLGTIELSPITGAKIAINHTFSSSVSDGKEAEVFSWYDDLENLIYSLYNETTGKEITQFSVQNSMIVLLEDVSVKDNIKITVYNRKNTFNPVTVNVTISENYDASATFAITELGGIKAIYSESDNAAVIAILYDSQGSFSGKYNYTYNIAEINDLPDGEYTLITMGKSDFFSNVLRLSQYETMGLTEGTDYLKNEISIESGKIETIINVEVPLFDNATVTYTEQGSFYSNITSLVVGNFVTLKCKVNFKEEYLSQISNAKLVFNLPESNNFVENSLLIDNVISSNIIDNNTLTVQLDDLSKEVRFCVIPTASGTYHPNAFVVFTTNGKEITEPVGTANYTADDLSIALPTSVTSTTIPITGTAPANSKVEIFNNGILFGQTTVSGNGFWSVSCELEKPYNLSTYSIYAKITTPDSLVLQTETKECSYNKCNIEVNKVTMYHCGQEVIFDFLASSTNTTSYTSTSDGVFNGYSFTIDFTDNNPDKISNVILYVETYTGETVPLRASYDERKGVWITSGMFGNIYDGDYSIPVNVSVDFVQESELELDSELFTSQLLSLEQSKDELKLAKQEFDDISQRFITAIETNNNTEIDNTTQEMMEFIGLNDTANEDIRLDDETFQQLVAESDENSGNFDNAIENIIGSSFYDNEIIAEHMKGVTINNTSGITADELIEKGFEQVKKTDGTYYYMLLNEDKWEIVDFITNLYITIDKTEPESAIKLLNNTNDDVFAEIQNFINQIQTGVSYVQSVLEDCVKGLEKNVATNRQIVNELKSRLRTRHADGLTQSEVDNIARDLNKYVKRLNNNEKVLRWIKDNVSQYMGGTTTGSKVAGKAFSLFALIQDGYSAYQDLNKLHTFEMGIESPCEQADRAARSLINDVANFFNTTGAFYIVQLGSDVIELAGFSGGVAALIPTAGASSTAIIAAATVLAANIAATIAFEKIYEKKYEEFSERYRELYRLCGAEPCYGDLPCPPNFGGGDEDFDNNLKNGGRTPSGCRNLKPIFDPSGYVYEAVKSNRLQGVTATCYYKETIEDSYGDIHEQVVLWDAAEYAQQNPLFTDENGMYHWDVPQGLWQVKYEKQGYQTAYSEWLPVPPPQLEVNIGMTQYTKPEVSAVRVYDDCIEIDFSKYMQIETLNTDMISVTYENETIEGSIEFIDEEDFLSSKIRYKYSSPLVIGDKIVLSVNNKVTSYAGLMMESCFMQEFDITTKPEIFAPENIEVIYGKSTDITLQLISPNSVVGKNITVNTSIASIASISDNNLTINDNGEAKLTVTGEFLGSAVITLNVPSDDITAKINVKVIRPEERTISRDIKLQSGWNWISVNVNDNNLDNLPTLLEPIKSSFILITDGNKELSYNAQTGFNGELSCIKTSKTYKIKMSADAVLTLTGTPADETITLSQGWNYISYIPQGTLNVNETLGDIPAEIGDVVAGHDAFAIYNGTEWMGTLKKMSPGYGYIYYSQSVKSFNYTLATNDEITPPKDTAPSYDNITYDTSLYPNIMNVIATAKDENDNIINLSDCVILAYVNDECRGLSNDNNEMAFLTIHGESTNDNVSFKIINKINNHTYISTSTITFNEKNLGSSNEPYVIECKLDPVTTINTVSQENCISIYPNPVSERLNITADKEIAEISVHSTLGECMINKTININEGLDVSFLADGVYLITIECDGVKSTHKFFKKAILGK